MPQPSFRDSANRGRRVRSVPNFDSDQPALRIGLDQQLTEPPYLERPVLFRLQQRHRRATSTQHIRENDTELCDIITVTGKNGTKKETAGAPQIWKTPRQCVVALSPDPYRNPGGPAVERQWFFKVRDAEFRLIPRRTQSPDEAKSITDERRAFAALPDPNLTLEGTMQRIFTLGLQALQFEGLTTTYKSASTITINPHNTRFRTPLEPAEEDQIRFTRVKPLGRGGQGEVHKVVDTYTGVYHACKVVAVKAEVLDALDFVHTRDPPIIHRDIKPSNILYLGDQFLTDFGIAKVVDTSHTVIGTTWYMAPEVLENREQTPKVDIWGLGLTVVECLVGFPPEERRRELRRRAQWYEHLQGCLNQHQHARPFASMLAVDTERRPTAAIFSAYKAHRLMPP
ncbi:Uu.00g094030.m01.CDS01 [Anthostomella pinea]|uniref:Uu.00g094030.m01.CDS01 n=1 Tax=Anthostomella pinea TaxID=933095 RepID=A0AAI8VP96_9PEZI|nr:Uu.00g094030.m01.CDS01 [Anthostomella pinea]